MITIEFYGGPLDGMTQDLDDGPGDSITVTALAPRPGGGSILDLTGTYRRQRPGLTYMWDGLGTGEAR